MAARLPEGLRPVTAPALSLEVARAYLRSRNIDEELWDLLGIGACMDGYYKEDNYQEGDRIMLVRERIVVPLVDAQDELFGWVARSWSGGKPPYLNLPGMTRKLFNEHALYKKTDEPVLVVEGVMDALPLYPHAVAVLGKPTELQLSLLVKSARPVVVALDGDAADEGWALATRLQFEGVKAGFVWLPPRKDPNDMGRDWMLKHAHLACA